MIGFLLGLKEIVFFETSGPFPNYKAPKSIRLYFSEIRFILVPFRYQSNVASALLA
jgi:hypothetical protein